MGDLQLTAGSLFAGRFLVEGPAGAGGMGTVYRACDVFSGEVVALKLLHAGRGVEQSERFAREAQILRELHHPGIVGYVAHGKTPEGQRFLAMDWLQGEDLAQRLLRGPLRLRDCVILLDRVTAALQVAHQRGIVHRDLKPTNLFLPDGDIERIKILDFGIARRLGAAHAMTRTGIIMGTLEYMAPEQARGLRNLTPAADVFALGCILYECLTGQPPFVVDQIADTLMRILFEEPAPLEAQRPGLPVSFKSLLGRLLCKDSAQRLADAAAVRDELQSLGELPEPAPPTDSERAPLRRSAATEQGLRGSVPAAPSAEEVARSSTLHLREVRPHTGE